MSDLYNVVQFFDDGTHEYVRRNVSPQKAVEVAKAYTESVGAQLGTTVAVIITDDEDLTNFRWEYGKGIVFPSREEREIWKLKKP